MLGFTPQEYWDVQDDPDIDVEDLLQIELCTEYTKTPIQTLDGIHINQPKRFLPLAKEAFKIAEALHKEQQVAQWARIPPEKISSELLPWATKLSSIDRSVGTTPFSTRVFTPWYH